MYLLHAWEVGRLHTEKEAEGRGHAHPGLEEQWRTEFNTPERTLAPLRSFLLIPLRRFHPPTR